MTNFRLDYESKSEIDLDIRGLDNYMSDPSTKVLMAAYAEGDHRPKLWQPHLEPKMPNELRDALEDPWVTFNAWNAAFERLLTKKVLRIDKPINEWRDTMVKARYLSLPGKLDDAGEILGLGQNEAKMKEGKRLIKLFCSPAVPASTGGLFGSTKAGFRDWSTDPEDWELFGDYCKQDLVAERTIDKKLDKFVLPEQEWDAWFLDQKINSTGWPVDRDLVQAAGVILKRDMEKLMKRFREITGLDNPNSPSQMMEWLQTQNYRFSSIDKKFVARALNGECDLTEAAREALIIRGQTAKSSVKKYSVITNTVSADGRLRYQYTFMGAARTGRWAAHGANVGNLPRPEKNVEKRLDLAIDLVRKMDYGGIIREFKNPLDVISSTIRPSFRAPEGYKFIVCDLNAIENRGLGYICRCDSILKVFREKRDPYLDFATKMYNQSYEELLAEYEAGNKVKRNNAKPATLGCGYALGPGEEKLDGDGNKVWTGLMGYSRAMGVEMTQEEAKKAVKVFRDTYSEVKATWKDFERAAIRAIRKPGQLVGVGVPQSDKDRSYFISKGRNPDLPALISFLCTSDKVLEMKLPSGRSLHYLDPRIREYDAEWQGETYKKTEISYYGKEMNSQSWGQVTTHGGKLLENADQGLSRDVLVHGMKKADAAGFQLVGHTYDEIVALVRVNSHLTVQKMEECMTDPPEFCGLDFPLGAEGYEDTVYRKA